MAPSNDVTGMEAAIRFQRLRQTGSARAYAIEFDQLWERMTKETFFASAFFVGLKDEIQGGNLKLGPLPLTWEAIAERAKIVENNLYEERKRDGSCYKCGRQGHMAKQCERT
jgi:hypothetical protein